MSAYPLTKLPVDVAGGINANGQPVPVDNGDMVTLLTELWRGSEAASLGILAKSTWAELSALTGTNGQWGRVVGPDAGTHTDPVAGGTVDNEGEYIWYASPGPGWKRVSGLARTLVHALNIGAGSANAVQATSDGSFSKTAYKALISVNFTATNTGPVTLSINGETPRDLVTNTGNPLTSGYIKTGMAALVMIDSNGDYRLFSYGDAAAIQAAAESWANFARLWSSEDEDVLVNDGIHVPGYSAKHYSLKAAAAAAALVAAVNVGYSFDTRADAIAADIPAPVTHFHIAGRDAAFDGGGVAYARVVSEPAHALKFQSNDGAWWEGKAEQYVHTAMFGAFYDTDGLGPDNSSELTDMVNYCNSVKTELVQFGPALFNLDAALPTWTYPVHIIGTKSQRGGGNAPTTLYKRYVEADTVKGILSFSDWGAIVEDMNFQANGAASGGSALSFRLTGNAPAVSRTFLHRLRVSCGDGVNFSLYVNGETNVNPSGPSYRGFWMADCELFGAALNTVSLIAVHHFFVTGTFAAAGPGSGGSGAIVLQLSGNATTYNDDIQWHGVISGKVNINWCSRSVFVSPQTELISVDANTTSTMWVGAPIAGTSLNNLSPSGFIHAYHGMVVARGGTHTVGWRKFGDGRIQQRGVATVTAGLGGGTWPIAFTSAVNAWGRSNGDSGSGIINLCQFYGLTTTGYNVKSADLNYTTGAVGAANVTVPYNAEGI